MPLLFRTLAFSALPQSSSLHPSSGAWRRTSISQCLCRLSGLRSLVRFLESFNSEVLLGAFFDSFFAGFLAVAFLMVCVLVRTPNCFTTYASALARSAKTSSLCLPSTMYVHRCSPSCLTTTSLSRDGF